MCPLSEADLIAIRRDLHQHPELSHHELRTASVVAEQLREAGLTVKTGVAGRGVVADLVGAKPGKIIIYRADMDALSITEANKHGYESANVGVMHACGHDVHTTIGIGVARALAARQKELAGTIRFVFQPAEEAAAPLGKTIGAEQMVKEGVLNGVSAAYALHVMPLLDVGKMGFTGGSVWASSDTFDITVLGKMAHGAYPHEGRDPILTASAIVVALQQLSSRVIDARDAAVVSVCRINSGTAHNIIPESALLQGTIRTLSTEVRETILKRLPEIVNATAQAYGCTAEVTTRVGAVLTANDPATERRAVETIRRVTPEIDCVPFQPQMGAEDFSAFSKRVPGCYLFLGVRNEERGITHMIHTPEFDVDERCLEIGVRAMSEVLMNHNHPT